MAKRYEEVGPYPTFGGKPIPPSYIHGNYVLFPEYQLDSSIVYICCLAYNDFSVTEFIEVVW